MRVISSVAAMQKFSDECRLQKKTIGFVPTMGYLHEGHLSLIRQAKKECDVVVTSIFVNPTQFAPHEDFEKYPRNIEHDSQLAHTAGTEILFTPTVDEMYPVGYSTSIVVEGVSSVLEGKFRPTHYQGVTTVVGKLFSIVQPDKAYFGQKDAQQCAVIQKMVRDLNFNLAIVIVPTMRETDGLAMSSRNVYLNEQQRTDATVLFQSLEKAKQLIDSGERNVRTIVAAMQAMIQKKTSAIDYVEIVNAENLSSVDTLQSGTNVIVLLAVRFGTTRLIDNCIVTVKSRFT